jgi:peptidoglycan/xylan/chitin deacetylase (PgdA/CDA1 family)
MPGSIVNLTFHGLGHVQRRLDPGEDEVWGTRDAFLSVLDTVTEHAEVRISFDDGNLSDVEIALPELCDRGLRATFFVVAGRVGSPGFLDEHGVRALAAAGMGIGCHGMRHRPWKGLDERALHEELVDARRMLEEIVERPVTTVACPFGSYDRRVLGMLSRCRYERVYTSDGGATRADRWIQARNTFHRGDDGASFQRMLSSKGHPLHALRRCAARQVKRWR